MRRSCPSTTSAPTTLPKYGGELLAADTAAYAVEGTPRTMNAIIRFPSREAALGLYRDPDYQEAKRSRQRSTSNSTMALVEGIGGGQGGQGGQGGRGGRGGQGGRGGRGGRDAGASGE